MDKKFLEEKIKMIAEHIAQCAAQHNALCGQKAAFEEMYASLCAQENKEVQE